MTAAIVFDAVGTLLVPEPGPAVVYATVSKRFNLSFDPAGIAQRFRAAFQQEEEIDHQAGWVTSESRELERWRRIVSQTLPGLPEFGFEELFSYFAQPAAWLVPVGAPVVLAAFAAQGLRLGVGSNFDSRLFTILAGRPELAPVRDRVVVSSQLGLRKPHHGFFHAVAERMDCRIDQVLFVGDNLENDFRGATSAGMASVLLDPDCRHPEVAHRVVSLNDLLV